VDCETETGLWRVMGSRRRSSHTLDEQEADTRVGLGAAFTVDSAVQWDLQLVWLGP
jgi:hypothetical protein